MVFVNETTNEFQYYEVSFRSTRPGPLSMLSLQTPVRQAAPGVVKVDNPLPQAVTFQCTCNLPEVQMPSQFAVPAQSEVIYAIDY